MNETIYRGRNDKVIAKLQGDTLMKTVDSVKHKLHYLNAYAFDTKVIEHAKLNGCTQIKITERDTEQWHHIKLDKFELFAKKIDFRHGEQLACPLKYWRTRSNDKQPLLL